MRIGIVAQEASPTVERELAPALRARGHTCEVVSFGVLDLTALEASRAFQRLLSFDLLYYRTSLGTVVQERLKRFLLEHKKDILNLRSGTHPNTTHKRYQVTRVADAGIPVPRTCIAGSVSFQDIVREVGLPFVAKASVSSQGRDVHRIEGEATWEAIAPEKDAKEYLCQSFVPHDHDIRVHIVGGKAVAAYSRVPVEGDFRANVHRGARMVPFVHERKDEVFAIAERVNALFGLDISAVDFLPHKDTDVPYFAEINSNPGWEAADTKVTGVDLTACVVPYMESCVPWNVHATD